MRFSPLTSIQTFVQLSAAAASAFREDRKVEIDPDKKKLHRKGLFFGQLLQAEKTTEVEAPSKSFLA